ncbi:MAG TPA: hypothetical protein PKL73_07865 [Polyangiaceae bacterium]|jgi:hypothetical protein|nr:hypothetical protein [Polyangiaceae bacterium]HNZ20998.1 hypothetical protein [Polyangiaceae bacterium]HOE48840.1 hypothetical protein [Polyangiaceae bacterium]HOG98868.1 hypothetical protein [Polyangiaceae bacterium]HOR36910.1 hypothetical protein [Polyangiaceae bacterium]
MLPVGCALVMDTDFDKYEEASSEAKPDAASAGEAGVAGAAGMAGGGDAALDVIGQPDTGGDINAGGKGGASGNGGSAGEENPPTCEDGRKNQGEEGVDCGGPCPPCPTIGFVHTEDFNGYPDWGPDGSYKVSGSCHEDPYVEGWGLSNTPDPSFSKSSGMYAMIDTDDWAYIGLLCVDAMYSPILQTHHATELSIEFDSSLLVKNGTKASAWLVRDGKEQQVWQRVESGIDEHVAITSLPANGAAEVRVYFLYEGMREYFWKIDNVRIEGK